MTNSQMLYAHKLLQSFYRTLETKEREYTVNLILKDGRYKGVHIVRGERNQVSSGLIMTSLKAKTKGANQIVMSHNHPSGCFYPSKLDIKSTKEVKDSLETNNLQLLDHLIFDNENRSFSFWGNSITPFHQ